MAKVIEQYQAKPRKQLLEQKEFLLNEEMRASLVYGAMDVPCKKENLLL